MFNLNKEQAKSYDQRGGFITEAGKYTGVIESAVWYKTEKNGGSKNVILNFANDSNQKARFFVNVMYHGNEKNESGIKLMNALLACVGLQSSGDPSDVELVEYDYETKSDKKVTRQCFKNLHGKKIGIVVQMVHEDGREYPSATIYSLFNAENELTASEIVNGDVEPKMLSKVLAYISEKPLNDKRKNKSTSASQPSQSINNNMADDIPF